MNECRGGLRHLYKPASAGTGLRSFKIRQLSRKYKDPPEGCEEAIALVLAQAQALADD
jgi:hypothetical protein